MDSWAVGGGSSPAPLLIVLTAEVLAELLSGEGDGGARRGHTTDFTDFRPERAAPRQVDGMWVLGPLRASSSPAWVWERKIPLSSFYLAVMQQGSPAPPGGQRGREDSRPAWGAPSLAHPYLSEE